MMRAVWLFLAFLGPRSPVLGKLLLLFIVVPLVELALLLKLAELTSWEVSMAVVIVSGVVGTLLARSQGFRTYQRIQEETRQGRLPAESLMDALMIFVAGALLLTPGLLTDLFGLSLLIPFCRRFYRARLANWFKAKFQVQGFSATPEGESFQRTEIIDSYVIEKSDEEKEDAED